MENEKSYSNEHGSFNAATMIPSVPVMADGGGKGLLPQLQTRAG